MSQHLLRQWEDAGLLSPQRMHGQRRYNDLDVRLVKFIRLARELGIGLGELREIFAIRSVAERTAVLQRRKAQLEHEIALANRQLEMIEHGLECPYPDYRTCPELAAITEKALTEGVLSEAVLAPDRG